MKQFLNDSFLLENKTAEVLYNSFVRDLPIIDYHSHLNPDYLAENKRFPNIAALWVTEDPYKHRVMRINGIPEQGISGNASEKEKFLNWARIFPKTLANPLFHWSCLELKRVFGIDEILSEKNAEAIWNQCNSTLEKEGYGAMDILGKWKVEVVCTSDDLTNDLIPHQSIKKKGLNIKVLPSLRSDSIIAFDSPGFLPWLEKISGLSKVNIKTLDHYKEAIINRFNFFYDFGCKLSDHSLDAGFLFKLPSEAEARSIFLSVLEGKIVDADDFISLKSYMLVFLGEEYCKRGWIMELHIGAYRYTSSRLRELAGPAGGYATIGNSCDIISLCNYLNTLEKEDKLPGVILFTLNPTDNEAFATLTGSFAQDGIPGKIQFGPAWWYNDHYYGIQQQLIALSQHSLLSRFIGMTTDSRSILSFSRHEYFRRILCNMIGDWVKKGHLPNDLGLLEQLVKDVSYNNSRDMVYKS
jgi:glucuronate isomerase